MLPFYPRNELILNLMPATVLKIVGTVACLPWCSISSSFQNSLKISGHQGYMSFGVGILSHSYRFPVAEEFVVVFDVFFI